MRCVGEGKSSTAAWEVKNSKRAQVDGDVPVEQGTATPFVVDGQVSTVVADASSESTVVVDGAS